MLHMRNGSIMREKADSDLVRRQNRLLPPAQAGLGTPLAGHQQKGSPHGGRRRGRGGIATGEKARG